MKMTNLKIWVRLVAIIWLLLFIAWGIMIYWASAEQRRVAIEQAHTFAESVHQMTMAQLLFMKVTKTIKKRAIFLDQIRQSSGVRDIHLVRSAETVRTFGDGLDGENKTDELDRRVLADGKPLFLLTQDAKGGEIMRAILPAINVRNYLGRDCLECHDESPENAVLGAVSMNITLDETNKIVAEARYKLMGVAFAISIPILLFIYYFIANHLLCLLF